MGQANVKRTARQKLIAEHSICCFCGGSAAATTADHVPNKAFFKKRDWPRGYEFPACSTCQGESRISELVCAAVARADNMSEDDLKEVGALYRGFARYDKETFREFVGPERASGLVLPSAVQARLRMPNGWAVMNIGERLWMHLQAYARKLTKALYYKHTGTVLPSDATIELYMVSNADIGTPHERTLGQFNLPGTPTLVRCSNARNSQSLSDQFEYRYVIDERTRAVFQVRFHHSLLFWAAVNLEV